MNTRDYKQISESIFKFSKSMNLDYKELIQLHYEILFAVNTYFTAKSDAISTQIRRRLASIFEKKLGVSHEDVDVLLEGILTHTNIDVNDNANNIEILKELMQLVYLEENNGDAADHIEKLCGLFDNNVIYILGYLNKYLNVEEYKNAKSPVHDACLFNLPDISDGEWTPSLWAKLVNNNLNKPEDWSLIQRLLASAPSIEREYRKKASNAHRDFSKETPQTLHQYMLLYKRKTENVIAAVEFHKKGIDEDSFNDYLDLKPCDDHKLLPEVTIIDEDFTLSKLPAEDPRAAILGAYTGCCQSLGSHGEDCVRYGIEYPNAGFYIITNNKKNLQIVSQFFAWRVDGQVVIDSLESSDVIFNASLNRGKDIQLVRKFSRALLHANAGIEQVHIGLAGRTPIYLGVPPMIGISSLSPPGFGEGYRDSTFIRTLDMTDDAFFKLMQINDRHQWWLQAAERITSIGQLIQCILRCPLKHYQVFAKYFYNECKLTVANAEYNDRPNRHGNIALAYALMVTDPKQFEALCDLCIPPKMKLVDITEYFTLFDIANEATSDATLAPYLRVINKHYRDSIATAADLIRAHTFYKDSSERNNVRHHLAAAIFDLIIERINDKDSHLQFTTDELSALTNNLDDDNKSRLTNAFSAAIAAGDDRTVKTYYDFSYLEDMCGLKFDSAIRETFFNHIVMDPAKYITTADELNRVLSKFNERDTQLIIEKLQPYYTGIIKTYVDYEEVCKHLNDQQQVILYEIVKNELHENDAFRHFDRYEILRNYQMIHDPIHRTQYLQDMLPILFQKIINISDYTLICKRISPEDRKYLFDYFKPKFIRGDSGFCIDPISYAEFNMTLDADQQKWFFNTIKSDLISNKSVFKTRDLLPLVFSSLQPLQRTWLFDNIKSNILAGEQFLRFSQFDQFYKLLDDQQRSFVMSNLLNLMHDHDEDLISSIRKSFISNIFSVLQGKDHRDFVTAILAHDLVDLSVFSWIENVSDLHKFISLLAPEELTQYLVSFKQKAAYPQFASKFPLAIFTDIANYFPPHERSHLLRYSQYSLQQHNWTNALSKHYISVDEFNTFLDIYLNKKPFKKMFKRIMQNINHSYYSTPSITFDEKINRLELVLHHPLVAGAKEKRRIQTGLTLFTIKDRALNSMQVAIQAEIDKLTAAQTIKNEK